MCIVICEGGCAFVQNLNVTDTLWVDGEKMCACMHVCVCACAHVYHGGRLAASANACLQKLPSFHKCIAWKEANPINRKCI